mmetsp:Transcript_74555/g.124199  ORF Transcript_74555/g.124199 Transcript_74555/m.124199 type:complete len:92 (-) Transcript_74555:379-654(-)
MQRLVVPPCPANRRTKQTRPECNNENCRYQSVAGMQQTANSKCVNKVAPKNDAACQGCNGVQQFVTGVTKCDGGVAMCSGGVTMCDGCDEV